MRVYWSRLIHFWSLEELTELLEAKWFVRTIQDGRQGTHDDISFGHGDFVVHQMVNQKFSCLNSYLFGSETSHQCI